MLALVHQPASGGSAGVVPRNQLPFVSGVDGSRAGINAGPVAGLRTTGVGHPADGHKTSGTITMKMASKTVKQPVCSDHSEPVAAT